MKTELEIRERLEYLRGRVRELHDSDITDEFMQLALDTAVHELEWVTE